ncbi:hypothetical protein [Streptomyces cinnamoneus]|nr:hypothetical protein [Streptomyces cinnamoneus]
MPTAPPTRAPGPARRALPVAAAALALLAATGTAPSSADTPQQHCGDPGRADFPLTSRLSGGPDAYERGAAPRTWQLELRNVTGAECRSIHPVAVLADKGRALRPDHFHLDFYDKNGGRWLPVRFERTDEAENVGVLDDRASDFPGFAIPAHGSVAVPLRLAFTPAAPGGPVTANVTAVQKRGTDGAWVGESDDYTFAVEPAAGPAPEPAGPPRHPGGAASPSGSPAPGVLADTGDLGALLGAGAVACALLAVGAVLVAGARTTRRKPPAAD